ncbi:helix-turn-helix domain-containing protein [Fredinandcohnia salidurans]|uniref:Helix-turn-helix domain-containing protein n=1 Tax=Fredinandcohnia salidurans TaxID=2595041 RepID=A0ABW4MR79_9BACI
MLDVIGQRIRILRKKKKWNQKYLAEKAGISTNYLGAIERGIDKSVSYEILNNIAKVLGVTVGELERNLDLIKEDSEKRLLLAEHMDMLQKLDSESMKELISVTPALIESFKRLRSKR